MTRQQPQPVTTPLARQTAPEDGQPPVATAPRRDPIALEHELRVHQIELESQNEELRRAQLDLAMARDRFVDLYDFAPVGYFTLDVEGRISEVNLTGTALFGTQRKTLLGRRFERFVAAADSERWRAYLHQALHQGANSRIELAMRPASGALQHAQLDSLRVASASASATPRRRCA